MNREIKFRGRDIRNKKYYNPVFIAETEVHAYVGNYGLDCVGDISEFIIEQYTGLKDKNGVKIYEGDIVNYHETQYDGKGRYAKIVWKTKAFMLLHENGYLGEIEVLVDKPLKYEVIGNVHEEEMK